MTRKSEEESVFLKEVKRDIGTFRRLHGKARVRFVWDYFRWKILAGITILICILLAVHMLILGQRPTRLRVCVVLNNDGYCSDWFDSFRKDLQKDGNRAAVEVNEDQPFDYDNAYSYMHELEVMTTISSQRMDAAVCGPDMYSYLLALGALAPLDNVLPAGLFAECDTRGMVKRDTAGLKILEDGSVDRSDAFDGCFALDISDTAFGRRYNPPKTDLSGQGSETHAEPLYYCIISNTEHTDDCAALARALVQD